MARLLILVDNPAGLSHEEAGAWLREAFDRLIEFRVPDRETARQLADGPEGSALLADFRQLGMHPAVQVVEG